MTTSSTPLLEDILFLDIETVAQTHHWSELDADWQHLWTEKSRFQRERKQITPEQSYEEAGIYAEFGKIICISAGYFRQEKEDFKFHVTSFYGTDERQILETFVAFVDGSWRKLCAHNGKEFDFPFLCRRLLVHGLEIPDVLDLSGKKPWENPHIDTMEMWKFGDFKHYTSLRLLAKLLHLPTPKDDIDGSRIREVFYQDNDLERIERYCKKDVVTVARIYLRLKTMGDLTEDELCWESPTRLDLQPA
jgi:predicted PolB exonuclease-like 3'-5' exonuclease